MEKQKILANASSIPEEQLVKYINQGILMLDDLKTAGLNEAKRKKIKGLLEQLESKDDEAWERARYGNEAVLRDYISNYPAGKHVQEAKDKIQDLIKIGIQEGIAKQKILDNLQKNPNSCSPADIIGYLKNGTMTASELRDCGIPDTIIETINNINPPVLNLGATPTSIPDGYTEVYFWGIPGSGKTCALAALLSTADKAGLLNIAVGPGYDYMTRLKNIFIEGNAILPPPSPVETTQYLPFTLKKADESFSRSVSLIELSGEIFQCFYYKNAGMELPSQSHQDTFNTLDNFLKSNNRKIHFFFIDYDKENKKDAAGYTQSNYLEAASTYFSNHTNQIFGKYTDAVYIILTKSDLMPCSENERIAKAKEHLNHNRFSSFINTLKDHCKKHSINAGKLTVEPFSLGKVYLQQICDFDNSTATKIIEILMDRIAPSRKTILDVFNK